jgi:hypothetical protein
VIGTPDDFIAQLERLREESGGFGRFLQLQVPWADWAGGELQAAQVARAAQHAAEKGEQDLDPDIVARFKEKTR